MIDLRVGRDIVDAAGALGAADIVAVDQQGMAVADQALAGF